HQAGPQVAPAPKSGPEVIRPGSENADFATDPAGVLLVSAPGERAGQLTAALARRGYPPSTASSVEEAEQLATTLGALQLIIIALPLPDARGRNAIERIKASAGGVPFIVVGVDEDLKFAADAFDLGAQDHLTDRTLATSDFLATVGATLGSRRGDRHLSYLRSREAPGAGWQAIVGESDALARVVAILRQVSARSHSGGAPTILVLGETGTGKGLVAKCFHYQGARRNRPFVEVNCAALPPSLMEGELFGHERGAFTDAKTARAGLFETADGGTLFLDEIGAVPLDLQAKLLTALEEKRIRRVGGSKVTQVDVQIVT